MEVINTSGRRKTSVARIYMTPGSGQITVNKKEVDVFFPTLTLQYKVKQPLELCQVAGTYDIKAVLSGGGTTGQAEALRLAIAKALLKVDEEQYRPLLRKEGMLTRDNRMVERKKPGQKKARKKFQFSKR